MDNVMYEDNTVNEILNFAEALEERANARGYEPFRPECRADVKYMLKAAQLLRTVTLAYNDLAFQMERIVDGVTGNRSTLVEVYDKLKILDESAEGLASDEA